MSAQAVNSECGIVQAGRRGPLAPFIEEMRNGDDARLLRRRLQQGVLRPTGEDAPQSGTASGPLPGSNLAQSREWVSRRRGGSKRRDRRSKRGKAIKAHDPKTRKRTKSRQSSGTTTNNGRHDSKKNKAVATRTWSAPTVKCVICGADVTFTNETRCEDCFASDQKVWHGRSLSVDLNKPLD